MAVFIDSSVWIASAKESNPQCLQLKRLIQKRETIYVTDAIRLEVCQGAKTEKEFTKLWESFLGFNNFEMTEKYLYFSAVNFQKLRRKGVTASTIDCMIATIASINRVPLWSVDELFKPIAPILDVKLFVP